jgi:hypothetical protein
MTTLPSHALSESFWLASVRCCGDRKLGVQELSERGGAADAGSAIGSSTSVLDG